MSVPGLNPAAPPAQAPAPIPPQILPPRPESPRLRNRPAGQGETGQEDTASERGLKRGRSPEDQGMDVEPSSEPVLKRRRGAENEVTPEGLQALIKARNIIGLRALLQHPPELLNALFATPLFSGITPLCYAAWNGFEDVVRCLIDCNASLQAAFPDCNEALIYAVKSGHLNVVKLLHAHGANLTLKDASGGGCLHFAVQRGDRTMLAWLLDQKAVGVDVPTNAGVTPLMQACGEGNLDFAALLYEHGAKLDVKDTEGKNCLHYVAQRDCLEFESDYVTQRDCLEFDSVLPNDDKKLVEFLVYRGACVYDKDRNGITPLMHACGKGNVPVVDLLCVHGADCAAKDTSGKSSLHFAAEHNKVAVMERLLRQCVAINDPDQKGATPLMYACRHGSREVASLLHERRANLTAKDAFGDNCLHYAVSGNQPTMVSWVLDQGVGVDWLNDKGFTPLIYACSDGHLDVARLLNARGANLAATEASGKSGLHFAAERNNQAVVVWLLEQGVSVDGDSGINETPLSLALAKGNWEIVEMLIQAGANLNQPVKSELSEFFEWIEILGDKIFKAALKSQRYDVLQSLMAREWPLPEDWSWVMPEGASDDFANNSSDDVPADYSSATGIFWALMDARNAAIHDLRRVFWGEAQPDQVLNSAWLSPEKNPERKEFIGRYLTHFFNPDSDYSDLLAAEPYFSSHPFFSYTIHHHLKHLPGNSDKFLTALACEGVPMQAVHQKNILLFKLQTLEQTLKISEIFQNKHLSPAAETTLRNVLTQQRAMLTLAASEYVANEQAELPTRFVGLCEKYLRITGKFDAPAFKKALAKHLGLYGVNADRLTVLIGQAWEALRRRPLDLPSMVNINQAVSLSGRQAIEGLLGEMKKLLIKAAELPNGAEHQERVESADAETYPSLSAQLKTPLHHPPEPMTLLGFTRGLEGLVQQEQQEQDLYANLIFDQWRQINAAFGVSLPEPFAPQQ